jgi:hypothetical protein
MESRSNYHLPLARYREELLMKGVPLVTVSLFLESKNEIVGKITPLLISFRKIVFF